MIQIRFGAKSARLPVATGSNGVLFNVNFFYSKQLHCAKIESSAERV
jgi:hypothetical protein